METDYHKANQSEEREVSDLSPTEEDFGVVYDYLPSEGHPQDVEEDKCPYCALRRVHARIAELEAENSNIREAEREGDRVLSAWVSRAEQAEATIERLKVCGNCRSMEEENMFLGLHICGHLHPLTGGLIRVRASDRCYLVPSRWTACAEIPS